MSSKLRKQPNDWSTDERKQRKGPKQDKKQQKGEGQHHTTEEADKTPLKLTIKIGGQTLGEKSVIKSSIRSLNSVSTNQSIDENSIEEPLDLPTVFDEEEEEVNYGLEEETAIEDIGEPDEEEEWLDALEEGRLHEVDDELKKIRDPKLMTARQRALLENKSLKGRSESNKSMGSQESDKTMSEEMIERKLVKDRRRRQQAEEKKEKDKKQTIDRLLKKRQELAQKVKKKKKTESPKVTYKSCEDGIFICLPVGMPLEQIIAPKKASARMLSSTTDRLKCSRDGCENEKKYMCSKSKQFVCSLQCYKEVNKIT